MSKKIKIKLKPFDVVVKELGYWKKNSNMYHSKKCSTSINKDMISFFDSEIVVEYYEDKLYRYDFWVINDMWVERDPFKINEIGNLFDIILEDM